MKTVPTRLGAILELERIPVDVDPEKEYTQIGIKSFGRGIFHREAVPGSELSKLRYFEVHPDRLIVSNIMAWEGAIGVSNDKNAGCVGSSRFLSYRPISDVELIYLNYFFQSEFGRSLITQTSTGTVMRNQTLSTGKFEKLSVPLPSIGEQRRIAIKLDTAFDNMDHITARRQYMESLQHRILHSCLHSLPRRPLGNGLSISIEEVPVSPLESYNICGVYSFGRVFARGPVNGSETSYARLCRLSKDLLVMSRLKAFEGALAIVPAKYDGWFASPEFPTFQVDSSQLRLEYLRQL